MFCLSKINTLYSILTIITCILSASIIITLWSGIHILTDDRDGNRDGNRDGYYNIIIPYLWFDTFGFFAMGYITDKIRDLEKTLKCKEVVPITKKYHLLDSN